MTTSSPTITTPKPHSNLNKHSGPNVILPNGARYYVDHAHPEYSTPECITPRDLVIHDKAGERILERSLQEVQKILPPGQRLNIYKNNSDGKGNPTDATRATWPTGPSSSRCWYAT